MKINDARFIAPLAVLMFGCSSVAMAAAGGTCSAPLTIAANTSINGLNNCAPLSAAPGPGDGDTSISTLCGSNDITGGFHVFTWHYGGANTPSGNLTITPTAPYNPAVFVGEGADCATAVSGFCDAQADSAGQTVENIALSGLATTNTTYFLFVASTATGTAKCGVYNLGIGNLPVKLQSFSIN